jgi:putative protease
VILSRELGLDEIAEIRQRCPDMELEVFVHGALCIAYSGRCLLSGYFNSRDANQGTCTNACRWDYGVHRAAETAAGAYVLEERTRPGELLPIEQDEHGTYVLNSKDLRAIRHVAELARIGVDSLKVEGRTKSAYYVARTAWAYRRAIDDAGSGRFDEKLLDELEHLSNRGYTEGFFDRHTDPARHQNYATGDSQNGISQYVGDVVDWDATTGQAVIRVRNRFCVGDSIELLHPAGKEIFRLEQMWDKDGQPLAEARGDGWMIRIPLARPAPWGMLSRLILDQ